MFLQTGDLLVGLVSYREWFEGPVQEKKSLAGNRKLRRGEMKSGMLGTWRDVEGSGDRGRRGRVKGEMKGLLTLCVYPKRRTQHTKLGFPTHPAM